MKNMKAFTLIELVIVITAFVVLGAMFSSFITKAAESWAFVKSRESAVSSSRRTVNRIISELRRIKSPSKIITFTTSQCTFEDIAGAAIDFHQAGTNIYRNSDVLADSVLPSGLAFTYYDGAGSVTATAANIRVIKVNISVNKSGEIVSMESSARVRNL